VDAGLRRAALAAALALPLSGCYYGHLLKGQVELLSARVPIADILADPAGDPALKHKLERALDARAFASRELALPDNGSYTSYAELGRPYAVWNVFAAPELSLQAHEWCYLMVGCLAYRGYYDRERADAAAAELRGQGLDVFVAGIAAYSTLGWFDDPLLSTMGGGEDAVAGTIFHELAHQAHFADGDTAFNESYATFVEQEGLRRYLAGAPELVAAAAGRWQRRDAFLAAVTRARARLEAVYAGAAPDDDKRRRKREELERLRQDLGLPPEAELNNARLLPYGLYHQWVPAFARLFAQQGGDWHAFHRAVGELAGFDAEARRERLERLNGPLNG
jgi:predicted aminopeptidase